MRLFKSHLLALLMVLPSFAASADDYTYVDQATSLAAAQNDRTNWMKYLPDDMFVAHLSVPGTHDTFTKGVSIITASSANAQSSTFSEQIEAGFRGVDLRPGWSSSKAMCMHGIASCSVTVDEAFSQMKSFLDEHPTEMFFIHMFKGNTASDDSNASKLANAMKGLLNNGGTYGDYIIDFTPMLTVGECRGKIVLFLRDNLFYLGLEKAGNMTNWTMQFYPNNPVTVRNASNTRVKTILHSQDVSDPSNGSAEYENDQDAEERFCKELFQYAREQANPNTNPEGYVPFFVMNLTSGEGGGKTGQAGYRENAKIMTPIAIEEIRNSWEAGSVAGPTGMIFSDFVLDDSYCGVNTVTNEPYTGSDLVNTIIDNNFYYCDSFKLTDPSEFNHTWEASGITEDLFGGREYYLYNVGAQKYLECGMWWGTHATLGDTGLRVTITQSSGGGFIIDTNCRRDDNNHYLSKDDPYVDQSDTTPWDIDYAPTETDDFVIYAGSNTLGTEPNSIVVTHNNTSWDDPYRHWKIIPVEDRYDVLEDANEENPIDATFAIPGAKLFQYDKYNDNWGISTPQAGLFTKYQTTATLSTHDGGVNGEGLLHFATPTPGSIYKKAASWSVDYKASNLPKGNYVLEFNGVSSTPITMSVNNQNIDIANDIDENSIKAATDAVSFINNSNDAYKHVVELEILDGEIEIKIEKNTDVYNTTTTSVFKDFKLTYKGYPKTYGDYVILSKIVPAGELDENNISSDSNGGYVANTITIDDQKEHHIPVEVDANMVNYSREVKEEYRGENGWHALYLPFDIENWQQIATRVIEFTQVETTSEGDVLIFEDVESDATLEAHTLYLAQVDVNSNLDIHVNNQTVFTRPEEDTKVEHSSNTHTYTLTGNYELMTGLKTLGAYALSGNEFKRASSDEVVLKPFRAYLTITPKAGQVQAPARIRVAVNTEAETNGIEEVNTDSTSKPIYNIKGQVVTNPDAGVYVIDGKKVFIR